MTWQVIVPLAGTVLTVFVVYTESEARSSVACAKTRAAQINAPRHGLRATWMALGCRRRPRNGRKTKGVPPKNWRFTLGLSLLGADVHHGGARELELLVEGLSAGHGGRGGLQRHPSSSTENALEPDPTAQLHRPLA